MSVAGQVNFTGMDIYIGYLECWGGGGGKFWMINIEVGQDCGSIKISE